MLLEPAPRAILTVRWSEIRDRVEPLRAPLAGPGDQVQIAKGRRWSGHRYIGARPRLLPYGFSDMELGASAPTCEFEDPDPGRSAATE